MAVRKRKTSRKKASSAKWPLKVKLAVLAGLLIVLLPFYYGYLLRVSSATWFWLRHLDEDENYRTYKNYEIKIPKKYSVHGIDVSYYQGKIDWQKVKEMEENGVKVAFAFIKATEGMMSVDPYFQRNWREAPKHGIKVGAYHFFRPKRSGTWQANFFLQTVGIEKGDLPPVVDIESLDGVSPEKMRKELNSFIIQIEQKTKVRPIIYTGLQFYRAHLMGFYEGYDFWVAHYHQPQLKLASSNWKFWQHSDRARVNGINHSVDFNVFNGDSSQFNQLLIK